MLIHKAVETKQNQDATFEAQINSAKEAEKGKQSPAQFEWQIRFEEVGGKYLLIRSLEDVKEIFN